MCRELSARWIEAESLVGEGCLSFFCWQGRSHEVHFDQAEWPTLFESDLFTHYRTCEAALMSSGCLFKWELFTFQTVFQRFILIFLQESHKRAQNEKREPLDEDQLFLVDLARDLSRVCQVTIHSLSQTCLRHSNRPWKVVFTSLSTCHQPQLSLYVLPTAEIRSPRAHLEPGRHLAHLSLQGLHHTLGLHVGEQGAYSQTMMILTQDAESVAQ